MNIIDAVIILFILTMGVIGLKKGVIKQTVSTLGFIAIIILAFYLKNPIAEFLSLHLPFFKFGGFYEGMTTLNIILYQLIAFIIVIILLEVILQALIKISGIVEKILKFTIILGIPSKILGFIVGIVEGFVITFIVLFFLKQPAFNIKIIEESSLTNPILNSTPVLSQISQGFVNTFNDLYELGKEYSDDNTNKNDLNLASIDVMLKHKIIKPSYVIKLVDVDKIDVAGIDSVVNKYR